MVTKQISMDLREIIEKHLPRLIESENLMIQNDLKGIEETFKFDHQRI